MKTTVAFSIFAAVSMVALPVSAGADCTGYHQSKVVTASQPAPVATPAAETATAQSEAPAASAAPANLVADLAAAGETAKPKAE